MVQLEVRNLRALLDFYVAEYKVCVASYTQYRALLGVWFFARIIEPVIYMMVWSSIAGQGELREYSRGEFAAYYIVIMVVNQMTFAKVLWRYEERIRYGSLSQFLLRPMWLFHKDAADNLGFKTFTLLFMSVAVVVLVVAFQPTFTTPLWSVLVFFPALVCAWMVNQVVDYAVGMLAFWVTRTDSIDQLFYSTLFFFSGRFAPLVLLPLPIQWIANVLPFRWILTFPTQLALGQLSPAEALSGFVAQGIWFVIGLCCTAFLWRIGTRHYGAVGG
jgi:ABC-2 type transport system permease protein